MIGKWILLKPKKTSQVPKPKVRIAIQIGPRIENYAHTEEDRIIGWEEGRLCFPIQRVVTLLSPLKIFSYNVFPVPLFPCDQQKARKALLRATLIPSLHKD